MNVNIANSTQTPPSLWQKALDQSASGIIVYKAVRDQYGEIETYTVQLANHRAEQVLGIDRNEMLGRTAAELFPPTQATTLWDDIAEVIETGEAHHAELFYKISRTQQELWFDLSIEPLGDGQSAVVSFTDITALKKMTQTLMGEAILFKALSSNVPGMCVVVVSFFQKVLSATGDLPGLYTSRDADDLLGKRIVDVILPEYQDDWKRYISTALRGEEHNFSDHWGGWRCECYVGPVRNERGDVVMALCVYRNTSEQFRQQQTLQRMNNELQQSNRSLEQFAYVASHDLQEPLRKIKSFGDLLNKRYADDLDEEGTDIVHRMQSAADRMDTLIRSLLAYARLSSPGGLAQQQPDLVALEDLLICIQNDLEVIISERDALITIGPYLPTVPGDATQLRQLFQNLLTNAIKFTQPSQRPEVKVMGQLVEGKDVPEYPDVEHSQTYARISVQDNGIGIAPENFDKIFGLFSRLHGRQQFTGSGIGLATCKRVAENHGGFITVESALNHGTTFHVYLPMGIKK
ncbi:ATP-binding protein [Spirosoma soli]|uniref:histidine kinase n=1 Tax=Spirosoma soli TaxID=1770529 RepID=A0ABW5MAI8_9BACT